MMRQCRALIVAAGTSAALLASQSAALAVLTTTRLVYAFTYSSNQDITARDQENSIDVINPNLGGNGNTMATGLNNAHVTSGISHYGGTLNDKGKMIVDVVSKQSDGGLVVSISELGENVRKAPPATCVVYGNTTVVCDPNKTVYSEEYALLRFLGSNFVDPNQLDASKHWAITQTGGGLNVKADYVINGNSNGILQIGENRSIRRVGTGSLTTDVQTKIGYDYSRAIPTSVNEYVTQRHDNGVVGTSTTTYQTTLSLLSSSPSQP